jgi:hypothetical protein
LTPALAGGLTIPQTQPRRAGKTVIEQHLDLADALADFPEWIIDHRRPRIPPTGLSRLSCLPRA